MIRFLLLAGAGAAVAHRLLSHRVEGSYFQSGDVRLHFTDEGPRDGEPVVLLHGFAVNADLNWRRPGITRALAQRYRVVALDLRGHGLSGKPYDPERYGSHMVDDVVRLLDHLRLERAHVAGYSLGGFVALKLAATHPERLTSVSVLGAGWEPPENRAFVDSLSGLADDLEAGRSIGPLAAHLGGGRRAPTLLHTLWVHLMTKLYNDPRALVGVIRGVGGLMVREDEVARIRVPLCSVVGGDDTLVESARALAARASDVTQTVIGGADHIRAMLSPELREALLAFLHEHRAATRPTA